MFFSPLFKERGGGVSGKGINHALKKEGSTNITACLLHSQAVPQIFVVSVPGIFRKRLKKEFEDGCTFYRDERNVLSCDLKSALDNFKKSS